MNNRSQKNTLKELFIYITIAYLLGLVVRFVVLQNVWHIESYWYEGRILPIWNDDAGLYGYYAKQILQGIDYPFEGDYILGYLIAWIVELFGIHIDWVMLILPAFLASLVVIPIIVMGYLLDNLKFSFYASLIGVIGINYYTRSHLGYIDTDTINLILIYLLAISFVVVAYKHNIHYALIGIVALVLLYHFYHSSKSLIAGVLGINFLMTLLFYHKNSVLYQFLILLGITFTLTILFNPLLAMTVSIGLIWLMNHPIMKSIDYKVYLGTIGLLVLAGLFFVDLSSLYGRALDYLKLDALVSVGEYHIANVLATVSENRQESIFAIYTQFVGVNLYIVIATLGYILLIWKQRAFIFLAPLLILGYLSFKMGIRFTIYAEMVLALGFVYLLNYFKKEIWILVGVVIALALMLYNIISYNHILAPKHFNNKDITTFNSLNIKPKDIMISWWDYGWPLWYYMGSKNTYIDNGANTQGGTLFVAKMLLSNSTQAYDLAKIIATQTRDLSILNNQHSITHYAKNIKIEKRNVYILLHRKMFEMFNVFSLFADRDIKSGKPTKRRKLNISKIVKYQAGGRYLVGENFTIDLLKGSIRNAHKSVKLYGRISLKNGHVVSTQIYNKEASNAIILNRNNVIYIDKESLHSLLIQSLLLNQVDQRYFERVTNSENLIILKVSIYKHSSKIH